MDPNLVIYVVIATTAYLGAVMLCWKIAYEKNHNPQVSWLSILFVKKRPSKALQPPSKALLVGALPGAILTFIIMFLLPNIGSAAFVPVFFGVIVTVLIVHRHLLFMVADLEKWKLAISILFVFFAIAFHFLINLMLSYFGHL